jgi:hypothetical protein
MAVSDRNSSERLFEVPHAQPPSVFYHESARV